MSSRGEKILKLLNLNISQDKEREFEIAITEQECIAFSPDNNRPNEILSQDQDGELDKSITDQEYVEITLNNDAKNEILGHYLEGELKKQVTEQECIVFTSEIDGQNGILSEIPNDYQEFILSYSDRTTGLSELTQVDGSSELIVITPENQDVEKNPNSYQEFIVIPSSSVPIEGVEPMEIEELNVPQELLENPSGFTIINVINEGNDTLIVETSDSREIDTAENVIVEENEDVIPETEPKNKIRSRWKKANPQSWKRNVNKQNRSGSSPYNDYKGRVKPAKAPKHIDCSMCKFKCTEVFSQEQRVAICKKYWALDTFERKNDFILQNVSATIPKNRRPRKEKHRARQNAKIYFFNKGDETHQVCQKFFMATLCISNYPILTAFAGRDEHGTFSKRDMRGRSVPPSNKTSPIETQKVKSHIESFPCMESHYSRKSTKRKYLDCKLSIAKMYNLYKEHCHNQGDSPVSQTVYRRIFCTEYNYSFFKPKKDQCLTCSAYENSPTDEKTKLKEEYFEHIRRKNEAHESKAADKDRSSNDISYQTVSFDLQSVLQIPCSDVSLTYYMRKLNMYNLTVYESKTPNRGFCFSWTEINGKRGSCEIGTCLKLYVDKLSDEIKHLTLYSDTCGGQNRNVQIASLFLNLVQTSHLEVIEHKYLESGHSYMEADSMHSAIESQKRLMSVYCVNDWLNIFKLARSKRGRNKSKPPYDTQELKFYEFLDLKHLAGELIKNRTVDEEGEKINWLKVKCFKYEKNLPGIIQYRYDYSSPYKRLMVHGNIKRRGGRKCKTYLEDIPKLYKSELVITKEKKKDLLQLCTKKVIPAEFHPWYQGLPTSEAVQEVDFIPEPDVLDSDNNED